MAQIAFWIVLSLNYVIVTLSLKFEFGYDKFKF